MHVFGSFKILFVINCQGPDQTTCNAMCRPIEILFNDIMLYYQMNVFLYHCTSKCLARPVCLKVHQKTLKKIIIWENFSHLNEINLNSKRAQLLLFITFSIKAPKGLEANARVFSTHLQGNLIFHQISSAFLSSPECLRTKYKRGFPLNFNIPQKYQAPSQYSLRLGYLGCTPDIPIAAS